MFGLLFTLSGSVLLAFKVAIRNNRDINESLMVISHSVGEVNPRTREAIEETFYFRVGLVLIALGTLMQIFPEFDLVVAELNLFVRLSIIMVGFFVVLGVSEFVVKWLTDRRFSSFPSFNPEEEMDNEN
ncbi:hypothetical protein M5X17_31015 [Paenibacillus alvei]|uniref:hypothetical protein n=1 Tax=Paenibacillus alvei TaxID=44250 RepID=UPI00228012CC|nr:hypothetical protein [Paenibacillus alvei]MCY9738124.1 hypothetical protein [Paenibacillus alvei]